MKDQGIASIPGLIAFTADGLVYLATPYSHPLPELRQHRFEAACKFAAKMFEAGINVFSPIAHTHPIKELGKMAEGGWDYWKKFDRVMLERSDVLLVYMMPGWRDSAGVKGEIEIFRELRRPIVFVEADDAPR